MEKLCKQCGSKLRSGKVIEFTKDGKQWLEVAYVCGNKRCSKKDEVQIKEQKEVK